MATDDLLTNNLTFRWEESSRQLLVLDSNANESSRTIAKIDYGKLDKMSWPEASQFIGEFVTLLVPALRLRYASEFADTKNSPNGNDA